MLTGLDRLLAERGIQKKVVGSRVGLVAHPASVSRDLGHVAHALHALGAPARILFGPEHGYGGEAQDMVGVADGKDAHATKVRSLYGDSFDDLSPRGDDLAEIDVLVVDLQDVGARYYTFVWTAVLALRACAKRGVRVLVLDRPNPIGGAGDVEGACQKARFRSFVGLEPIPVRHGLTLGEVVAWRASVEGIPREALDVVGVRGLERSAHADAWDRPFVMPSPNMPTYDTALVYPGGCLLEGTNLSEGRGTTRPFEITGAPWMDGARLARDLSALALPGVRFRPLTFRPTFHKHAGIVCGGVQVHPVDTRAFRPYATYVALVALARAQSAESFRFRTEPYEFVDDIPAFDLLTGSDEVRTAIEGGASCPDVLEACAASAADRSVSQEARGAGAPYFL